MELHKLQQCPYVVSGSEGTAHCRLAERDATELAALKARIADSHEVTVCRHPAGAVMMFVPEGVDGKRVRLLVVEE